MPGACAEKHHGPGGTLRARPSDVTPKAHPSYWPLLCLFLAFDGLLFWPDGRPEARTSCSTLCAIPVEQVDGSVRCLGVTEALQLQVGPGDVPPQTLDGQRLFGPPKRMLGDQQRALGVLVDPNRANRDELEALPELGPHLANAILAARSAAPFVVAQDLLRVRGIGPKRLEKLLPFITFSFGESELVSPCQAVPRDAKQQWIEAAPVDHQ